jgi:hypothetical protein
VDVQRRLLSEEGFAYAIKVVLQLPKATCNKRLLHLPENMSDPTKRRVCAYAELPLSDVIWNEETC